MCSPRPNVYEIPDTPLTKLMITFVMCGKDDQHVDTKEEDDETLEPESHETLCADEEEPGGRVAVYQLVGSLQIASLETMGPHHRTTNMRVKILSGSIGL